MSYPSYDLTIEQARRQASEDSKRWFPEIHDQGMAYVLTHSALGLAGEAGEVVDEVKKWHRKPGQPLDDARKAKLGAELIDTLIYLMHIATVAGIDLETEFYKKREFNEARFGKDEA